MLLVIIIIVLKTGVYVIYIILKQTMLPSTSKVKCELQNNFSPGCEIRLHRKMDQFHVLPTWFAIVLFCKHGPILLNTILDSTQSSLINILVEYQLHVLY